jgi:outer membrane protein OmpA-like peptidoglycan-associated protein
MPPVTLTCFIAFAAAAACLAHPPHLAAQAFPALGGIGAGATASNPVHRGAGVSWFVDGDAGHVGAPNLRLLVGIEGFRSNRAAEVGGARRTSEVSAFGGRVRMRFDPLDPGRLAPYVAMGGVLLDVRTSAPAGVTRWPTEGVRAGGSIAAGLRFTLDAAGRTAITGEADRVFIGDMTHWALAAGVRYMPLGRRAYHRPRPPMPPLEDPRVRLQRESARMAEWVQRELDRLLADSLRAPQQTRADSNRSSAGALAALATGARAACPTADIQTPEARLIVVLGGTFAHRADVLSSDARACVERIAPMVARQTGYWVIVGGHTDSVGTARVNQRLSESRAMAVRSALIARGVDARRIAAVGYGEARPLADNATAAGRARNRRVEISIAIGTRPPIARATERTIDVDRSPRPAR